MTKWLLGLFCIWGFTAGAQKNSFAAIDWEMQTTDAPTPDSLARIINQHHYSELEKARAIFSWISTHITYNTGIFKPYNTSYTYIPDPLDTAAVWPSGDEMTARKVMRKRMAVCDGYARLFKVLCDYTALQAEVVQGFARGVGSNKFRTNHSWNVVKVDSVWHLVDVTWASGFLSGSNDYVQRQNDYYFFTPPEQFITDHYPEDLRWTLLTNPPAISEFKKAPFRNKNTNRYGITGFLPASGLLSAHVGDTLHLSLQLADLKKAKQTGADPFLDTAIYSYWPASAFLKPSEEKADQLLYTLVVSNDVQWVNLLFNDDVVIRYRLNLLPSEVGEMVSR